MIVRQVRVLKKCFDIRKLSWLTVVVKGSIFIYLEIKNKQNYDE